LGVELELQLLDFAIFVERSNVGPIDDIFTSRSSDGDVRDVDAAYQFLENILGRVDTRVTWKNERFAQLHAQQRAEVDPAKRAQLQKDLVQLVFDEAPIVPVYYPGLIWITNSKLKDVYAAPDTSLDLFALYKTK
jgi:ABC-type transport system substrate-binding protein